MNSAHDSMTTEPWYKQTLALKIDGVKLKFQVPHDVFSTLRIDEGTELLLAHLSDAAPARILDVGCGYGALGLPVALRYPKSQLEMIDRDLVAVEWANKNAQANGVINARAHASLGYRDVGTNYDWILCNVPARIGTPFIEDLFTSGLPRLNAQGEIRVVVIRDLGPVIEEICTRTHYPIEEIARGPRHIVYRLKAGVTPAAAAQTLYTRDRVIVGGVELDRPFDISGDSAKLKSAVPLLLEALPKRDIPKKVFCLRAGYGAVALPAAGLWADAEFTAFDRDVLATTYLRQNAERLGRKMQVKDAVDATVALDQNYDLILGEISPACGERVAVAELRAIAAHLNAGAQALLLTLEKTEREWLRTAATQGKLSLTRLMLRDGYVVLRLTV